MFLRVVYLGIIGIPRTDDKVLHKGFWINHALPSVSELFFS